MKKKSFSPFRILIGLVVGIFLLAGLLAADDRFANMPYHQDILPMWTPDGKWIVFIRWLPIKNGVQSPFQMWKVDVNGKNKSLLYETHDGYTTYGIRRISFSNDGKYINMRLNRKIPKTNTIEDMLVKIPLSGSEKPKEWKLEKKHPFDIFLAFKGDKVLIRKMLGEGEFAPSKILEYSFSTREKIREIPLPKGYQICVWADYFGKDDKIFGIVKARTSSKSWRFATWDVSKGKAFTFECPITTFTPLKGKDGFFGVYATREIFKPYIFDSYGKVKFKFSPQTHITNCVYTTTKDGKKAVITTANKIKIYDLENCRETTIDTDVYFYQASVSPDGSRVAFSNGSSIFTIGIDGTNKKAVTKPSPKSVFLKKRWYRRYVEIRNRIIYGQEAI